MSSTPRGMSVQEAYRHFRDGNLLVNRGYQRKLVWTELEKQRLIDSILNGYPIPLFLLAERPGGAPAGKFEIIDGMQRLHAIVSFIENDYTTSGAAPAYFDHHQLARAVNAATDGFFQPVDAALPRLSSKQCANFLDYQLAVTIYQAAAPSEITAVFGRINAGGRQLSPQIQPQVCRSSHLLTSMAFILPRAGL